MNLKKGKFKIVEGTRVRMVSSKDTRFDIEVEADSEDEAWEKAYDTVDLGDLEVRDCEYSDDEITPLEE